MHQSHGGSLVERRIPRWLATYMVHERCGGALLGRTRMPNRFHGIAMHGAAGMQLISATCPPPYVIPLMPKGSARSPMACRHLRTVFRPFIRQEQIATP